MKSLNCQSRIAAATVAIALLLHPFAIVGQIPTSAADIEKYKQAATLFKDAHSVPDGAAIEKKREAIRKFLSAADAFHAIGSLDEEANALNAAADVHDGIGEKPEALRLYLKVADLLHEIGDRKSLAITLNNIGVIFREAGQKPKALDYFNVALAIRRELKDQQGEASALAFIGNTYADLGENPKAIEAFNQAIVIQEKIGDKHGEMNSVGSLGVVTLTVGDFQKALGYLERALRLAKALGDRAGEASAWHNTASINEELGNEPLALEQYHRSLKLANEVGNKAGEGVTLNNIGTIYLGRGEPKNALDYFDRAAELRFSSGDMDGVIDTLVNIGFAHSELGDRTKALEVLNRALSLTRKTGNRSAQAETLHNIGFVYEESGDRSKAIEYYNQALPLRRQVGDKAGEARTLANMMLDWNALANGRLAAFYGKQAINGFQELRSGIRGLTTDVRKRYLSTIEDTYRILADILIEQGRIAEAEEVLGMLKEEEVFLFQRGEDKVARELLQTSTLNESERAAVTAYETIAQQITSIAREYGELDRERIGYPEGKFPKQSRLDELERQRANANLAFQKHLDLLKVEFAKSSKDKDVAQVDSSLQETLREMNATRTAVVSTIAGEKRLNIIVTTADVQRAHTVDISEAALNKLVADFRQALTSPAGGKPIDPRPAGQKLYDILVKPIEGDLAGIRADTIVWSLDGTLRYLPMAAVWDKQRGYLAERFANAVITLASRDRLLLSPKNANRTALGAGVSTPTEGFSALAAVPDELDCIVTDTVAKTVSVKPICTTGVMTGQKLLDEKFSEAAFRAAVGRYSILHIASHFKLVPGSDNDSFLLLGGGPDRRFTINKLSGLSLAGVELLALSACNTATPGGAKENGVEIEGFGAIAQKRGARSVMATLWPVADPSTRDFMVDFYKHFGTGNKAKAESIRQAQLKLLSGSYNDANGVKPPRGEPFTSSAQAIGPAFVIDKKAPYAHPYYWAPFILFGNWR